MKRKAPFVPVPEPTTVQNEVSFTALHITVIDTILTVARLEFLVPASLRRVPSTKVRGFSHYLTVYGSLILLEAEEN